MLRLCHARPTILSKRVQILADQLGSTSQIAYPSASSQHHLLTHQKKSLAAPPPHRTFASTREVEFISKLPDLDRHPRARRLPVYEPPPPFPEADDVAGQQAYRDPPISVPPLEEPLLDYMIGLLMRQGKRTIAQKHIINLLSQLRLVTGQEPFPLLAKAVDLASPMVVTRNELKRIKVTTVPVALSEIQRARKGILWIVKQSERRPGKKFGERLAMEVIAVLNGNSEVLKLKAEQHRLAYVNRANLRTRVTRA